MIEKDSFEKQGIINKNDVPYNNKNVKSFWHYSRSVVINVQKFYNDKLELYCSPICTKQSSNKITQINSSFRASRKKSIMIYYNLDL